MIDAEKAKSLVNSAKSADVVKVEREIEARARAGFSDLNYYDSLNRYQIQKLRNAGFDVCGPCGGANGSHMWIQWNK